MTDKRILCLLASLSVPGVFSARAVADTAGGYAVAVSDSATPMERRAGVLLEAAGFRVQGSGIGGNEGRRTIYVGVSLASMTLGKGAGCGPAEGCCAAIARLWVDASPGVD